MSWKAGLQKMALSGLLSSPNHELHAAEHIA